MHARNAFCKRTQVWQASFTDLALQKPSPARTYIETRLELKLLPAPAFIPASSLPRLLQKLT